MATIRLIPSTYYLSSSSYLTVTNPSNMYANTDNTSYATVTNTRSNSTTSYYIYLRGFNFNDVPSNAIVSNISIKLKAYHSNGNTSTIYGYNGTTQVSAAGSTTALTTSATVKTFTNTTIDWATLKSYGSDFGIRINCRRSDRSKTAYIYIYGAEIEVTYTIPEPVPVTGVSLNKSSTSIEEASTEQLVATVIPSNADDKSVIWSSSNTSVATVDSSGVVTAVSAGTSTITVTTNDGGYTDTCAVTVTQATYTQYVEVSSMEVGRSYLIANGNSGSVYMLTNEANGTRTLKSVSATVSNGVISVTGAVASRCLFDCVRYTAGNDVTITVSKSNQYLYCDNASGLRMNAPSTLDRFWHFKNNKFWQFKSTASDGYSDTSSAYKYYLTWNTNGATDSHVDTAGIENSNIPLTYIFAEASSTPPTITVGTPSRTIISDESGYDQCVCTFRSNMALQAWEARATKSGVTPARGVGLLVESGTTLAANTDATIYVDDEELTQGDGEYTITVYGQSTGGVWSG